MASSSGRDIALSFVGGFLTAVLLTLLVGITVLRRSDVYGLGHWKLNVKMPLASLWMNLGYWCVFPRRPHRPMMGIYGARQLIDHTACE